MDISVIIAHYDPGNHFQCRESFERTLAAVSSQSRGFDAEVIIADDGSPSHRELLQYSDTILDAAGRQVFSVSGEKLQMWLAKQGLPEQAASRWLYLPKEQQCMSKARLANAAVNTALSEKLLFLDDDNYFLSNNSISALLELMARYALVVGQIQDVSGHWRSWESHRVQGTTLAVEKSALIEAGGFGAWTETVSSGVDSDLWWKLYHYFKKHPELKACFTDRIQTIDSCSKRWRPFIRQFFRHRAVAREFNRQHQCRNYRSTRLNPSRDKSLWMDNLCTQTRN